MSAVRIPTKWSFSWYLLFPLVLGIVSGFVLESNKHVTWWAAAFSLSSFALLQFLTNFKRRRFSLWLTLVTASVVLPCIVSFSPVDVRFQRSNRLYFQVLPVVYAGGRIDGLLEMNRLGKRAGIDFVLIDRKAGMHPASKCIVINLPF